MPQKLSFYKRQGFLTCNWLNFQNKTWTMCCSFNNAGIYSRLCWRPLAFSLPSRVTLKLLLKFTSILVSTLGIRPSHLGLKNTTTFSFFILLEILQSWHLISASNYLVSSILLLIFFKGAETFKIAFLSGGKMFPAVSKYEPNCTKGLIFLN